MKIGFIGAGKVGTSFGKYLQNKGFNIIGYSSRSNINLERAITITNTKKYSKKEIILNSEIIFITVNDNNLEKVLNEAIMNIEDLSNKSIVHMSGASKSEIFIEAYKKNAKIYSLHPLQSFSNIEKAIKDLESTVFSIESYNGEIDKRILKILEILESYFEIDSDKKAIYHMAACVFSNYLNTLMDFGLELTSIIGMNNDYAFKAMLPLIEGTIKNIEKNGIENSLTGPLVRGDENTIKKHLESINNENNELKKFYEFLGLRTLDYIKKNNLLDDKKTDDLKSILGGEYEENND